MVEPPRRKVRGSLFCGIAYAAMGGGFRILGRARVLFPVGRVAACRDSGCRLAGRACCGCASEGPTAIYPGFRFPGRPLFPVARIPGVLLPLVPELRTFRAWLPTAVRNCCLAHVRCPLFVAGREDTIPDRDADLVGIPLRRAVERVGVFGLYGAVGYMSTWPSKLYPL